MNDHEVRLVQRKLLRWGRENYRDFPWRSESNPWLSFVAEIFLQRTRAKQVSPFFLAFCERYPTTAALLADADIAVEWITKDLGLHQRGPMILEIARAIEEQGGHPPERFEDLTAMKGVGMYTASAWLSLHRGIRAVIIDANVIRWLSRMTNQPYNRDPRSLPWVQDLCERLTPRRAFKDYNYAVLDFTINHCRPHQPLCRECPFRRQCHWHKNRTKCV